MMYIEYSPSEDNLLNILKRVPTKAAASVYLVDEHEAATPALSVKNKFHNNHSSNSTIYTNGHINGGYSKKRLEEIVNRSAEFPRFPPLQRYDIAEYKLQQQQQLQTIKSKEYQYLLEQEEENEENASKKQICDNRNQLKLLRKDKDLIEHNQVETGEQDEEGGEEDVQNYTLIDILETDEEEEQNHKEQEGKAEKIKEEENAAIEDFFEKKQHLFAVNKNNTIKNPLRRKAPTAAEAATRTVKLNDNNNLKDTKIKNLPETVYKIVNLDSTCGEESEFEYQIIKENKNLSSRKRLLNGLNSEASSTFPYNPLDRYRRSGKKQHQKYYSPAKSQPIYARGIKRKAPASPQRFQRYNRRRKFSSSAYDFGENYSSESDNDEDLYREAVTSALQAVAETIYKKGKSESQMGLNIFSKIIDFFSFNKSNNTQQERLTKRKRRSTASSSERSTEEEAFPQIKYRRVENSFPKYVEVTSEDDLLTTTPYCKNSHLATNNRMTDQKIKLRKSLFDEPKTTRKIIKNTNYADIEFSDDDDIELERQASQHLLKNINFKRPYAVPKQHKSSAPATKALDMGGAISSSFLKPSSSPLTYAEVTKNAVKANKNLSGNNKNSKINNYKTNYENAILRSCVPTKSVFTSHLKDVHRETSSVFNGLKTFSMRPSSMKRHTMLEQQKQCEDHKHYLELLQGLLPGTYGNENNAPALQRKYSLTSTKIPKHKSSVVSSGEHLTSSNANASLTSRARQPLCSTINLLDDDDDEVEFTGVLASSSLRPNSTINLKKRELSMKTKNIIHDNYDEHNHVKGEDDNEVSEIIELDGEKAVHSKSRNRGISKATDKAERTLVSPVNTLFERIHTSDAINDSWIDDLKSKYLDKKKSRDEELREYEQITSKLEVERQNAEVDLQQLLKSFQIFDPDCVVVDEFPETDEEEEDEPKLVPLTAEHHAIIKQSLHGPPNEVLVSKFNLNITRRDIYTLQGLNWLNDEVINFYMNLLTERSEKKSKSHGLPTVYAMNTFFVSRLLQNGHAGVKRWTRKIDIFSKDLLPVPVHVGGVHWCMAIINLKKCSIKYYDSMGTPNPTVLRALEQYLKDESLDKRKQPFDTSHFEIKSVDNVPRQMNGSDCGVFSCMFAEFITRNCEITFSQQHMEYFRTKMLLEIVQGELLQ